MINCPNCGTSNQLGKVFCVSCGAKLPAQGLNVQDFERLAKIAIIRKIIFRTVGGILALWIVVSVVLALIPHTSPLTEGSGVNVGRARACSQKLTECASMMRNGKPYDITLTPNEITSYIRYGVLGRVENRSGSVAIGPGTMIIRWIVRGNIFGLNTYLSFDVTLCTTSLGTLRVDKVKLGHLNTSGPARKLITGLFIKMCKSRQEWPLISKLSVSDCVSGSIKASTTETSRQNDDFMSQKLPLFVGSGNSVTGSVDSAASDGGADNSAL